MIPATPTRKEPAMPAAAASTTTVVRTFPLGTVIFAIFLTLKLGGWGAVATWSWWWVTAPLWIPALVSLGVFALIFVFAGILLAIAALMDKKPAEKRKW